MSSEQQQREEEAPKATEEGTVASAAEGQSINVLGATPEISTAVGGEELKLVLGEFAGPMDLLLYLIRQEQVSIYDIPIARITNEYLRYLRLMQGMDITVASDFLVMAATLIEIKSKMLLPRDPAVSEEELLEDDPRRELVERLLEHQKYKAAAEMLWSRATVEQAVYTRAPIETDKENPEVSAGAFDLLRVFQQILARHKEEVLLEIEREEGGRQRGRGNAGGSRADRKSKHWSCSRAGPRAPGGRVVGRGFEKRAARSGQPGL